MRFVSVALIASLSSFAVAQLLDGLPKCAQSCVGSNFGSCQTLDIKCICSNKDLISSLSCCVSKSCSADDTQKTITFASQLCSTYGITVPTIASCPATASATGASAASAASGASSASAALTSASAALSGTPSAPSALSSAASAVSSAAAAISASAQAVSSNVAGHHMGSGVGISVAIAGFLAVL
ncbi:hypothetical protein AOQ84DRAFT_352052 [Glonium stellatum]|uniref:CFEM domain-containing protein n=1 Tax=Glonium stellatum TaxID=574774 RepID=A0A8E2JXK7_9PEZI|nr:hypothetical protein AOQ84DRAFT_352052 [Glonium stellatum]